MRLEHRTCKLIEEKEKTKVYKLKCSLAEAFQLQPYLIEQEPIAEYIQSLYSWKEWHLNAYTEDTGTGVSFKRKDGKQLDAWDQHLTFIIPEYWEQKNLQEGFYEVYDSETAIPSLSHYVRRIGKNGEKDTYYALQHMGGGGDEEYTYLKMLCDIEDTFLVNFDEIVNNDKKEAAAMMNSLVPLCARTYITIEIPKDMKI